MRSKHRRREHLSSEKLEGSKKKKSSHNHGFSVRQSENSTHPTAINNFFTFLKW
jgi:hypothetical protein